MKVIQAIPMSQNIKELASFLGATGCYSRFLTRYAELTLPLCHIKKRDRLGVVCRTRGHSRRIEMADLHLCLS